MAATYDNHEIVCINKVKYIPEAPMYKGTNGQVLAIINGIPIIKTKDSYIGLEEYYSEKKIKVGDRLKNE